MTDPQLLNTQKAAELIGATYHVLRISRSSGEIYRGVKAPKHVKMGRAVRYRRQDLDEWISQFQPIQKTGS